MKKYLFYLLISLIILPAKAKERTETERLRIVHEHFGNRAAVTNRAAANIKLAGTASQILGLTATRTATSEAFYIYNNGESAFVIISGDDKMKPVLGYSDSGHFATENMPENLKGWLSLYVLQASEQPTQPEESKPLRPLNKTQKTVAEFPVTAAPLLGDIAWDQDAPFNNLCPDKSVTGCVATAMAMIMKYYEYPKIGAGRHTYRTYLHGYNCNYDFEEKAIDWKNMLPKYTEGEYNEAQSNAVAELMKACGVSVEMNYDVFTSATSALKVTQAMATYFKYDANMLFRLRNAYTSEEWMNMIKKELSERRPILYNGASKEVGHEFVFDGYDEQDMIHINWGWGGLSNGYFEVATLDPLNPGIGGGSSDGGGYTYSQGMVIGIQPDTKAFTTSHNWYMTAMLLLSKVDKEGQLPIEETVSLGIMTLVNYGITFNGELGVALTNDSDGRILEILGKRNMNSIPAAMGGNLQFDFKIPEETPDGTYRLYLVGKAFKASVWEQILPTVGYTPYYYIKIKKGVISFYDPRIVPDLSGNYAVNGTLKVNKYGNFTVSVKNEGEEYYFGKVGVAITPSEESDKIAFYLEEVRLSPGEEKTVTINRALINTEDSYIEEGTSLICGAFTYGEARFQFTDFSDVDIEFSKLPKLTRVGELVTAKPTFAADEEFVLPVSIECEGDYDQYLVAAIFPSGATITNVQVVQKVDLKDGQKYDTEIRGFVTPQLKEGKYLVGLYYYDIMTGAYSGELGFTSFEVGPATGIESETSQQPIIIYPQPVTDYLNIRCNEKIDRVEIIGLAGNVVKQEQADAQPGEELTLSVSDLASGHYILLIHTENKTYREKFIKK